MTAPATAAPALQVHFVRGQDRGVWVGIVDPQNTRCRGGYLLLTRDAVAELPQAIADALEALPASEERPL